MGMSTRAPEQAQRKKTRTWDRYKNLGAILAERNHGHSLVRRPFEVHKLRATADRRHSAADDRQRGTVAFLPLVCCHGAAHTTGLQQNPAPGQRTRIRRTRKPPRGRRANPAAQTRQPRLAKTLAQRSPSVPFAGPCRCNAGRSEGASGW
jgi:hypothetical protein